MSFLVPPDGRSSSIRRKCLGASLVLILAFGSVVLGPDATRAATGDVTRLAGADRYATAAAISRATYAAGVAVAYIATGTTFPDALAGAAAAGKQGAPLLLTTPGGLPSSTATELARLRPGRIVVLGSAGAVSETVVSALRSLTAGGVTRLAGADRYATAAAISRATYAAGVGVAYVATGTTFPDALAGAAAAGKQGAPLLLTTPSSLPTSTATELARLRPGRIVVLGSAGAVSEAVVSALRSHTVSDAWPTTGRRPYTAGSAWNTPLAANASVDSRSAQMIATIAASSTGRLRSDPDQYTYPVVFADAATPRVTLTCTSLCSTVTADGKRQPSTKSMTIPLPSSARPSAGSDAQLIVIDRVSGDEYNLFEFSSAARSATNASRYVNGVYRDGMPSSYISRGAGIPYLAGLIRPPPRRDSRGRQAPSRPEARRQRDHRTGQDRPNHRPRPPTVRRDRGGQLRQQQAVCGEQRHRGVGRHPGRFDRRGDSGEPAADHDAPIWILVLDLHADMGQLRPLVDCPAACAYHFLGAGAASDGTAAGRHRY
ncbi:MAG: cell wall-binding repeat-containing protein [Chloroflexi bacterium]|nr:cell wall-binding repeat-containing protein [Chloroflexota bacterium]